MSRSLIIWPMILIPAAVVGVAHAQSPMNDRTEQLIENAHRLVAVDADGCLKNTNPNEIVVCVSIDPGRKYRLPMPELIEPGERIKETIPRGNAQYVNTGRCYIDASERKCFKGLSVISASFGGADGGVSDPAGRLWRVIKPEVPEEVDIKQAQIKESAPDE